MDHLLDLDLAMLDEPSLDLSDSDSESTSTRPESELTSTRPESESTSTRPESELTSTTPESESTSTRPESESTSTRPESESTSTRPESDSELTSTRPSSSSTSTSSPTPCKKRKLQDSRDSRDSRSFWTCLPCEILFKIFSQYDLSNEDLRNVRLVCKSWNSIFQSPQYWRKGQIRFGFTDDCKAMSNPKAALFMANNSGVHWRELKVELTKLDLQEGPFTLDEAVSLTENLKILFKTVQDFFSAMPRGNNLELFSLWGLHHFNIILNLKLPQIALIRQLRRQLIRDLGLFIGKQYGLKHLCLTGSGLNIKPGLRLLNAIARTQSFRHYRRANLLTLAIDNCFSEWDNVSDNGPFINTLSQMRYLTNLVINIEYLSNESLKVVADNLKDLLTLELACYETQILRYGASVTSTGWEYLVDQLPELQATVQLRKIVLQASLGQILVPGMPLTHIKLYHDTDVYYVRIDGLLKNRQTNFKSLVIEVMSIVSTLFQNTFKSFHAQMKQHNRADRFSKLKEEELCRMFQALVNLERISLPVHFSDNFETEIKEKRPNLELLYMGHGYERIDSYGDDIQIGLGPHTLLNRS